MVAIGLELDEQFQRLMLISLRAMSDESVRQASKEHEAIIDAVQAHDADRAAVLSCEHSARGHARILASVRLATQQSDASTEPPASQE
jgi:DNA-binding GntR family transcriptional regulator